MPLRRTPPPEEHNDSDSSSKTDLGVGTQRRMVTRGKGKNEHVLADDMRSFKEVIASLIEEKFSSFLTIINEIRDQNKEIQESQKYLATKYEEFSHKINILEVKNSENCEHIQVLERKIEYLERQIRSTKVEIRNIPKSDADTKEKLVNVVKKVGSILNINIQNQQIKDVFCINNKSEYKTLIVDIDSTFTRNKLLGSVKTFNKENYNNKLNTTHLNLPGPLKPIYISEHLTQRNKRLYYLAREFAKTKKYTYCWTSQGTVYLRKSEGSPAIRINTEADIVKLNSPVN